MRSKIGIFLVALFFFAIKSQANVVGADTQNFNPTTSGLDFVTVHSSETLTPGILNVGFYFNYAVNSLPNYENQSTQQRSSFSDTLLSTDLNFGLGLLPNWDAGISVPQVFNQSADDNNNVISGEFEETGLTEIRVNTKYRFFGNEQGGLATIFSMNFNLIENNPFTGSGAGPTTNIELAYDTTIKRWALGGNIGYRFRSPGTAVIPQVEPFKNQYIASVAASYLLQNYDIKLIGEIFTSFPAEDTDATTDRDLSSAELLGGIKMDLQDNIAFHAGAGTELFHGSGSPDWRVYTGVNWNFGPLFAKSKQAIVRTDDSTVSAAMRARTAKDPFSGTPSGATESFVAKEVLFEFNSDRVNPGFIKILKRMADYLKRGRGFKRLVIEGHTDSIGKQAYNKDLSYRRAAAVRQVLITKGKLPAKKVKAVGKGELEPIADNGNYQGRALNRRVEFKIRRR